MSDTSAADTRSGELAKTDLPSIQIATGELASGDSSKIRFHRNGDRPVPGPPNLPLGSGGGDPRSPLAHVGFLLPACPLAAGQVGMSVALACPLAVSGGGTSTVASTPAPTAGGGGAPVVAADAAPTTGAASAADSAPGAGGVAAADAAPVAPLSSSSNFKQIQETYDAHEDESAKASRCSCTPRPAPGPGS